MDVLEPQIHFYKT